MESKVKKKTKDWGEALFAVFTTPKGKIKIRVLANKKENFGESVFSISVNNRKPHTYLGAVLNYEDIFEKELGLSEESMTALKKVFQQGKLNQ